MTRNPERRVIVDGQRKVCRGFVSVTDRRPRILCNRERFADTDKSDQYPLIHHEYAVLARVEQNLGTSSDYEISEQLTEYLMPKTEFELVLKLKLCNELTKEDRSSIGTKCKTTQGAIFERVERPRFGEAWKLIEGASGAEKQVGIIWSDRLPGRYSNLAESNGYGPQAWEACQLRGGELPSLDEFQDGDKNGIREVLPKIDAWFWTSSTRPDAYRHAYVFVGRTGDVYDGDVDSDRESVLCVAR